MRFEFNGALRMKLAIRHRYLHTYGITFSTVSIEQPLGVRYIDLQAASSFSFGTWLINGTIKLESGAWRCFPGLFMSFILRLLLARITFHIKRLQQRHDHADFSS